MLIDGIVIRKIPQVVGLVYALVLVPVVSYLWYKGKFSRKAGYLFLVLTTLSGFLLFAPMAPYQFQLAVLGRQQALQAPIPAVLAIFAVIILFSLVAGRVFCGHFCPVGTSQELAYLLPVKKYILRHKTLTMGFRWAFFILFLVSAVIFSAGILQLSGIHEFFHLDILSPLFFVFALILVISVFVYRPFCRLFCPFGAILSLAAAKSLFRFRVGEACIDCGNCTKACPTQEAKDTDPKAECYMCGRCIESCKKTGALAYRR